MGGTTLQIQFLNGLQRIVPLLTLGDGHPGIASAQALTLRVDHGELTGAFTDAFGLHLFPAEIQSAAMEDSFRHLLEVHLSEVIIRTDGRKVVIDDALDHHLITLFKSVEVVKHKAIRSIEDAGTLAGKRSGIAGDQPEAAFAAWLGRQALGSPLLAGDKGEGIEGNGVLQEHRPVGGDGEVMQKGEARKTVGTVMEQSSGI